MAMVELAAREANAARGCCRPVCLSDIATGQGLSLAYLEQIFGRLRRAGLVRSARGPGGGYILARSPELLSIAEVVAAVKEPIQATRCAAGHPGCLRRADGSHERCQTHDLWAELGRQIQLFLQGVTLADVLAGRVVGRATPFRRNPVAAASPVREA
jgi:Rrf2 family iron-sulfur cluster assembly transcriptional regulator